MVSAGPDPQTGGVKEVEAACGPRPAEKGAKGVLSCWVLVRKDATKLRHLQYID